MAGQSILNGHPPCLCNMVGPRIRSKHTVAQALQGGQWISDITGALTVQVLLEYLQVWDRLGAIQLGQQPDKICWRWSSDRIFSTASAYRAFFIGQHPIAGAKLLYKTRAPAKCKFFAWLALHDRCWTAHRRKRHNLQDNDDCTFCSQLPETIDHLLISCSFTREVWFMIFHRLGWHSHAPGADIISLADWWQGARKQILKEERKCFDTLVLLICWLIWKERNGRIFDRKMRSVDEMLSWVVDESVCWCQAGFKHLESVCSVFGRLAGHELVAG